MLCKGEGCVAVVERGASMPLKFKTKARKMHFCMHLPQWLVVPFELETWVHMLSDT